jgi:23S rRNA pseudouridine955/2504/2580 synthase
MVSINVTENEAGCRLDRIVRKRLPLMSLSGIYALIRRGGVRVSGRKVRQDYRLREGDLLEIAVDSSESAVPAPEEHADPARLVNTVFFKRNFHVLFEDRDFIVCNKPAGLVVHPGTGHLRQDTLIDLAAAYLFAGKKIRGRGDIAPAHRLDRDTSGVILIAKNKPALRRFHEAIRAGAVVKQYAAICHRRPPRDEGEIAVKLVRGRDPQGETIMRVAGQGEDGQYSRSVYRVSAYEHGLSRLEVVLDTGRTHQIRIHCAHAGAPIVGDARYGDVGLDNALFSRRPGLVRRLYLHAHRLELPGLSGEKKLSITATLPEEFSVIMHGGQ